MEAPKVDDHITIKQDGEDRELFMSFGLLDNLTRHVATPEEVATVPFSPDLREDILKDILAKRTKSGKVEGERPEIDDFDISIADHEKLLNWAMGHILGFYVRNLQMVSETSNTHEKAIQAVVSSMSGQES